MKTKVGVKMGNVLPREFHLVLTGEGISDLNLAQIRSFLPEGDLLKTTDTAYRFSMSSVDSYPSLGEMRSFFDRLYVDVNIVPNRALESFKLVVSDMDSTFVTIECIDEIADWLGKKAEVAQITERAMQGEIDYQDALYERVALLKGLPDSELENIYEQRLKLSKGARALVSGVQCAGAEFILVSGGFTFFAQRLQHELGLDAVYANILESENGLLTGYVRGEIVDAQRKKAILKQKSTELNICMDQVIAIGDGANDLPMLNEAGVGIAYHAKEKVNQQTKYHIKYGDLSTILDWFC